MFPLIKQHRHIIGFGIVMISFSAPGQTFLISWFVSPIFNELEISRSMFAGMYSLATLSASLLLNPMGRVIDKYKPSSVVTFVVMSMAIGCFCVATASNYWGLFIGFFIVRLFGQGVMVLSVSSLIIKSFHKNRGKMMGLITLGYSLSELIYPGVALFLLYQFGWRTSYLLFSASNIIILLPIALWLLKKSHYKMNTYFENEFIKEETTESTRKNYILGETIKEPSFYFIVIAACLPPVIMTGLLFHQESIFNLNAWPIGLSATGLAVYAIIKALGAVLIGGIIDTHGPLWPFVTLIALLGMGALINGLGGPNYMIFVYFAFVGLALGISAPVMNVVWPNLYGTLHIGSIKGFIGTFRNGLTALGPLPIALAIDYGYSLRSLLIITAISVLLLSVLPLLVNATNKRLNYH
ncbi:hypothetical protein DID80_02965 [Candidatus Marinamargulisbacteria bacterium SCGC AAA071-K20]|nr:hypothetical protein DID80_02965 [Candidatus Marinamargulisbacteria bacterium SCGC AAA071-K20]